MSGFGQFRPDSTHGVKLWVARLAGELKRNYARKGKTLNLGDVIVAAVAIYNELTLLTDNLKDFSYEELTAIPFAECLVSSPFRFAYRRAHSPQARSTLIYRIYRCARHIQMRTPPGRRHTKRP